MVDKEKQTKHN